MKFNNWLTDIKRIFIPRPTTEENKRFDMAERVFNFSDEYFNKFLDTLTQEDFITYPSYADYDNLKDKIAEYNNVNRENIYLSTGSGACIKSLCEITMNPGYNVVSNIPSYPMYGIYGRIFGGEHIGVSYIDTTFSLKSLMEAVNDETRLVIIANPNSPIGDYKTLDELKEVCKFLNDKGIIFLIDEAYVDFSPGTMLPLIYEYENVVISRTFSKAFGAAGTRVGYLLGSKKIIDVVTKVQLTYPISNVSVKFVSYLLDNISEVKSYIEETIDSRKILCDILEKTNYDVVGSHTNSIHFHEKDGDNSNTINIMENHGIAFKSGKKLTGTKVMIPGDERDTWIRLSVGPNTHKLNFMKELIGD